MEVTFLNPLPSPTASQEDWATWMMAEEKCIRKQERKLGTSRLPDDQPTTMRKVGGVWKQSTFTGFAGEGENSYLEPLVEADQEISIDLARQVVVKRGFSSHKCGADRRRARKARRRR